MSKGKGYRVPPRSRKDIEYGASFVRRYFCDDRELYFPLMEVLERRLIEVVPEFEFLVMPDGALDCGARALTYPNEHIIAVEESVYHGALDGRGMDRVTLAHEIGHLFMHPAVPFTKQFSPVPMKTYESSEWQGDVFGGELLAPIRLISGKDVFEIAEEFGVSFAAARAQMNALRKIA